MELREELARSEAYLGEEVLQSQDRLPLSELPGGDVLDGPEKESVEDVSGDSMQVYSSAQAKVAFHRVDQQQEYIDASNKTSPLDLVEGDLGGRSLPALLSPVYRPMQFDTAAPSLSVMSLHQLDRLNDELQLALKKYSCGASTCISFHARYTAVGLSKGLVMVFDAFQALVCVLGVAKNGVSVEHPNRGFVSALEFNQEGKILAVGFSTGVVVFYDITAKTAMREVKDFVQDSVVSHICFVKNMQCILSSNTGVVSVCTISKSFFTFGWTHEQKSLLQGKTGPITDIKAFSVKDHHAAPYHLITLATEACVLLVSLEPTVQVVTRVAREPIARDGAVCMLATTNVPGACPLLAISRGITLMIYTLEVHSGAVPVRQELSYVHCFQEEILSVHFISSALMLVYLNNKTMLVVDTVTGQTRDSQKVALPLLFQDYYKYNGITEKHAGGCISHSESGCVLLGDTVCLVKMTPWHVQLETYAHKYPIEALRVILKLLHDDNTPILGLPVGTMRVPAVKEHMGGIQNVAQDALLKQAGNQDEEQFFLAVCAYFDFAVATDVSLMTEARTARFQKMGATALKQLAYCTSTYLLHGKSLHLDLVMVRALVSTFSDAFVDYLLSRVAYNELALVSDSDFLGSSILSALVQDSKEKQRDAGVSKASLSLKAMLDSLEASRFPATHVRFSVDTLTLAYGAARVFPHPWYVAALLQTVYMDHPVSVPFPAVPKVLLEYLKDNRADCAYDLETTFLTTSSSLLRAEVICFLFSPALITHQKKTLLHTYSENHTYPYLQASIDVPLFLPLLTTLLLDRSWIQFAPMTYLAATDEANQPIPKPFVCPVYEDCFPYTLPSLPTILKILMQYISVPMDLKPFGATPTVTLTCFPALYCVYFSMILYLLGKKVITEDLIPKELLPRLCKFVFFASDTVYYCLPAMLQALQGTMVKQQSTTTVYIDTHNFIDPQSREQILLQLLRVTTLTPGDTQLLVELSERSNFTRVSIHLLRIGGDTHRIVSAYTAIILQQSRDQGYPLSSAVSRPCLHWTEEDAASGTLPQPPHTIAPVAQQLVLDLYQLILNNEQTKLDGVGECLVELVKLSPVLTVKLLLLLFPTQTVDTFVYLIKKNTITQIELLSVFFHIVLMKRNIQADMSNNANSASNRSDNLSISSSLVQFAQHCTVSIPDTMNEYYIQLLLEFFPQKVAAHIQNHTNFNLERILDQCMRHNEVAASAYICERMAEWRQALELYARAMSNTFVEFQKNFATQSRQFLTPARSILVPVIVEQYSTIPLHLYDVIDTHLLQDVHTSVATCIKLCQRAPDSEQLWAAVLEVLAKLHLTIFTSRISVYRESEDFINPITNPYKVTSTSPLPLADHYISLALMESVVVHQIITVVTGAIAANVKLQIILNGLLVEYGDESIAASRGLFSTLFDTMRYERNILESAKSLLRKNERQAFDAKYRARKRAISLKGSKNRGSYACSACFTSLQIASPHNVSSLSKQETDVLEGKGIDSYTSAIFHCGHVYHYNCLTSSECSKCNNTEVVPTPKQGTNSNSNVVSNNTTTNNTNNTNNNTPSTPSTPIAANVATVYTNTEELVDVLLRHKHRFTNHQWEYFQDR